MMAWESYKSIIQRNCASPASSEKDLSYWRNDLFARMLTYLIPLCFIAVVPGLYMSLVYKMYTLTLANIITISSMVLMAFLPGIAIYVRKLIFIITIYIYSWTLVYYLGFLGLYGNALLFVMACCLLFILITPSRYAYWTVVANGVICGFLTFGIYFEFLPWSGNDPNTFGTWISVASNLVFLSALFALLLPRLFNGLQETMMNEKAARSQLEISEKQYGELFNLNPLPMWVYAFDTWQFLDVNEAAVKHYGYSREAFLQMSVKDLCLAEAPLLPGQTTADITAGAFPEKTYRHLTKNGKQIQVEINGTAISYKGKKAELNVIHDITERAQYVSTIEKQNKILQEIGWIQSHVVRAPLARMMGVIDILQNNQVPQVQKELLFKPLLDSAHELDSLIREISEKAYRVKTGVDHHERLK